MAIMNGKPFELARKKTLSMAQQFGANVAAMASVEHARSIPEWDKYCVTHAMDVAGMAIALVPVVHMVHKRDLKEWHKIAQAWGHAAVLWSSPLAYGGVRPDIASACWNASLSATSLVLVSSTDEKDWPGAKVDPKWMAWAKTGGIPKKVEV